MLRFVLRQGCSVVFSSRYQEWCAPFLFASRIASAAHAMVIVESEITTMLGMMHSPVRCLCRTGAAVRNDARQCTCHTIELRDPLVGLAEHGRYNQDNARHMQAPTSTQERQCNSNLKQDTHIINAHCSTALTPDQVRTNGQTLSTDVSSRNEVMSLLWHVAVPCRRVGRRRMGQPRCNQLTKITSERKRRQNKINFHGGTQHIRQLFMPKQCPFQTADTLSRQESKISTINEDTRALPQTAGSADKKQKPTKYNTSLRCRLLRLSTKLGAPSSKNCDARVDVPASKRITEDNCNETASCQPRLYKGYRFVGGGLAPASQAGDLNSASLPVCILCLRNAPDYVPFALQTTYSAKCSSCKRTNCNQCGSWEGAKFFCKWCFDDGITPSVEAMQSWKAGQQTHTGKPSIEFEHAKRLRQYALDMRGAMPVRFQGGGTEQLQCFMCLAYKSAYVSKQLSVEYVSHCYTCGRGACDSHGSWEVGHFYCALCHATDDGLLAEVKDTFAVRCLSKTFQNQRLLHTNEEAFNDLMLTLCTGGINRPRGMGNYDEQGLKVQPQEAAGVELPWDDARQLVEAIVLSRVNTPDDAVKVLGQSWVPTWDGWKELRQCATERCCVAIAERLCDIAQ